jgi:hypothetical protein
MYHSSLPYLQLFPVKSILIKYPHETLVFAEKIAADFIEGNDFYHAGDHAFVDAFGEELEVELFCGRGVFED